MPTKEIIKSTDLAELLTDKINLPLLDLVAIISGIGKEIAEQAKKGKAVELPYIGYIHCEKVKRRFTPKGADTFLIAKNPPRIKKEDGKNAGKQ